MKLIQPQNGVILKSAELQEHYTIAPRQVGPIVKMSKLDRSGERSQRILALIMQCLHIVVRYLIKRMKQHVTWYMYKCDIDILFSSSIITINFVLSLSISSWLKILTKPFLCNPDNKRYIVLKYKWSQLHTWCFIRPLPEGGLFKFVHVSSSRVSWVSRFQHFCGNTFLCDESQSLINVLHDGMTHHY